MSVFDIALLLVLGVAAVAGFMSGLVKQLGSCLGIVLGIVACRIYGAKTVAMAASLAHESVDSCAVMALGYAMLFLVVYIVVWLLSKIAYNLIHTLNLGGFDRVGGAIFKVLLWAFAMSLALNVWVAFFPDESPTGNLMGYLRDFAPWVIGMGENNLYIHNVS